MQKTKIIATIGPGTNNIKKISELREAGVTFIRLNMSHGNHQDHGYVVDLVRQVENIKTKKVNRYLGIIADLCGPKIRIGDFVKDSIELKVGQVFTLTTKKCIGDENKVFINYKSLPNEISVGSEILLDDGKKKLVVTGIKNKTDIETKVLVGGNIKSRRGVNIPNANLKISALTAKDRKDVEWGNQQRVDYFALSFVRHKKDVLKLRDILTKLKSKAGIISKIETPEAIENIDSIIEVSDAIMVARGDLAIEIGPEKVPYIQKQIIKKCNEVGIPVITATQMLESMVRNSTPTRAEVSDIANAIFDGTDAIMLSEETAIGSYPVEAVSIMSRTAIQAEETFQTHKRIKVKNDNLVDSVCSSVVHVAEDINAKLIIALTESGFTSRMVSRYRPKEIIIAATPHEVCARKTMLSYGVIPVVTEHYKGITSASEGVQKIILDMGLVKKGDQIILSAGVPFGKPGSTNTMVAIKIK